jgi:hypothetical protein
VLAVLVLLATPLPSLILRSRSLTL